MARQDAPETEPVEPGAEPLPEGPPAAPKKPRFSQDATERLQSVFAPVGLLIVWEVLAQLGWIDTRYFPAPSRIIEVGYGLALTGDLWAHTYTTVRRLFIGVVAGTLPAIVLGLTMGLYRPIRVLVDPIISATYPIPKSALLPLILLIFGLGEASKIVMVAIGAFYPVVINAMAGTLEIQKIHREVATNFQASRWQTFKTVALPGALPMIMTGVKLGVGLGLILGVLGEMIGAREGLGYLIYNSWQIFAVETMYVALVVIGLLGFALTILLQESERFVLPWKR